jgi:predicted MFS family arabinose efflux permease
VQQATEPSMQGRVMALHQMAWYGSTPIGALLMGWVIQVTSPRVPFLLGAVAAFACAVALVRSAMIVRCGPGSEGWRARCC